MTTETLTHGLPSFRAAPALRRAPARLSHPRVRRWRLTRRVNWEMAAVLALLALSAGAAVARLIWAASL